MEYILVTGGLGYIGSHTVVQLLNNSYNVIVVDNLSNSKINVQDKIRELCSIDKYDKRFIVCIFDLQYKNKIKSLFNIFNITCVVHFAGYKSVNESVKFPIKYYHNITITLNLVETMIDFNCLNFIFSSSATVYGSSLMSPLSEDYKVGNDLTSPYAESKYYIERFLNSLYESDNKWNIYILRYFNPIGCHPSGILGENPNDIPNNLFPYILKVASGVYDELKIYGTDYNTRDGSCLRDFIHVVDLADAHVICVDRINRLIDENMEMGWIYTYNVGTGENVSVKELIECFERVNEVKIKKSIVSRRTGDIDTVYADNSKIIEELGWRPRFTLSDMCKHGWNFIKSSLTRLKH
jgi:UDP-glucose 4-epimerase